MKQEETLRTAKYKNRVRIFPIRFVKQLLSFWQKRSD
jgi:hypothetical protein